MYRVYDSGKPAHYCCGDWNNSLFNTVGEAFRYAEKWVRFSIVNPSPADGSLTTEIKFPYDYSGYGDTLEIKEVGYTKFGLEYIQANVTKLITLAGIVWDYYNETV